MTNYVGVQIVCEKCFQISCNFSETSRYAILLKRNFVFNSLRVARLVAWEYELFSALGRWLLEKMSLKIWEILTPKYVYIFIQI